MSYSCFVKVSYARHNAILGNVKEIIAIVISEVTKKLPSVQDDKMKAILWFIPKQVA